MIAEGAISAEGRRLDGVLALPLTESPQGLGGHSYGVAAVCWDFHTSTSKWEDEVKRIDTQLIENLVVYGFNLS